MRSGRAARESREARDPSEKWRISQVVRRAGVGGIEIVAAQVFDALVGGLGEDLRSAAGVAKDALDAERLVGDRVAVAERREHLMHLSNRTWLRHRRLSACRASGVNRA
jgi:hypothetical protein